MNEKVYEELMQEADRLIEKVVNALADDGDKEYSIQFLLFVAAKFTAGLLLGLQEVGKEVDIAERYTKVVKDLMAIMGKDMKIQSIKNKIKENEEEIARQKLKQEEILHTVVKDYNGKAN